MLKTLAVSNYRSLFHVVIPLGRLNVITGQNGSGKSNLYRALRLLAETAQGGVVNALAKEGGLESTFWAGPEKLSRQMQTGNAPIQGTVSQKRKRMRLGFAAEDFGYSISMGVPPAASSFFSLDPEIKREVIWAGDSYRPAAALVDRNAPMVKIRDGRSWKVIAQHINTFDSMFSQVADSANTPEVVQMRETIRGWRFYDNFNTDSKSASRQPQLGTRTPVLNHDGSDLAAALQTIREIGDSEALNAAISDAFPDCSLKIDIQAGGLFVIEFYQQGLLRPLKASELSDGTLRYLLLVAALLTPRPPPLLVLNEPENSLHPDLLPALARLIIKASEQTQVWVVSHATRLVAALNQSPQCHAIELEKELGQTQVIGQGMLDEPSWHWPDKV
ncbi:MAG: AAA family ATPase [Cocleimonas sp.]